MDGNRAARRRGQGQDPQRQRHAAAQALSARRTLKILAVLLAGYSLLVAFAYWGPDGLAQVASFSVMVPYLSVHLFHAIGVPGLLEHGGRCGWGWCSPTAFGWAFLIVFWITVAWLIAWGLARLTAR